ncbi:hypothetical protein EYC84_006472 [Monilinia fructicola]|uniref:Uncharacterized protein n=1 Tax=Monilinia fructicola TaxID=38448 RepID=A0A5M9K3G5_MONFR|nr:hypothetical protein EYC84_006472 [Monilinia fructicola]
MRQRKLRCGISGRWRSRHLMYYMCKVSMELHLEVWNIRWHTKLLLFIAQLESRYSVQHAECSIILCESPHGNF